MAIKHIAEITSLCHNQNVEGQSEKVRFDLHVTDTLLNRSLNQSYRQISVKNFNKTFSSNLPWGQNGECLSQVYLSVFLAIKR